MNARHFERWKADVEEAAQRALVDDEARNVSNPDADSAVRALAIAIDVDHRALEDAKSQHERVGSDRNQQHDDDVRPELARIACRVRQIADRCAPNAV